MYTVVIAERNEADLENTINDIKHTQRNANVIVIHDKEGKGCQVCRDEGIMQAEDDIVIIVDGHMRFKAGCLDRMAKHVRKHPKKITCAKVHHNADISFNDSAYCGADIVWKSDERDQYWTLPSKWRETDKTGEIGCILGACYTMSRDRYINILKRPWRFGQGWGMDEEVLSITNWLCGGTNELVNEEVAHLCRNQATVPYKLDLAQSIGVWCNRMQLIDMLPMSNADRKELQDWLMRNSIVKNNLGAIGRRIDHDGIKKLREHYEIQERTFEQWKKKFIKEKEYTMTIQKLRSKCKDAGLKFSMKMTKKELNKLLNDPNAPKKEVKKPKQKQQQNTAVFVEPIVCPYCRIEDESVTERTYPNGNQRRKCKRCNRAFVAIKIRK